MRLMTTQWQRAEDDAPKYFIRMRHALTLTLTGDPATDFLPRI
jgi:hypothetical protein